MSFGFSLYAGWVGSALCFFGSSMMICCSRGDSPTQNPENRYYYSKHSGVTNSGPPINSHAKSAHVWDTLDKTSLPQDLDTHTHTYASSHTPMKYVKNLFSTAMVWLQTCDLEEAENSVETCARRRLNIIGFVWTDMKLIQRETVLSSLGMFFHRWLWFKLFTQYSFCSYIVFVTLF